MKKLFFLCSFILFGLVSCSKSENKLENKNAPKVELMNYDLAVETVSKDKKESISNAPLQVEIDRKLIKEATLKFATKDVNKTKESIVNSVKTFSGYIANEKEEKYPDKINLTINIRVPADKFEQLIAGISKGVERFDERNIEVKDVTSDYIDTEARIKTKKAIEQRYIALLSKAGKVEDMLKIEEALGTIREDIESMEGQFRYMSRQIEYSDINITFYQEIAHAAQSENRFLQGFVNGWDSLVWFFIGLINIWPFVIIISIAVIVFIKMIKRRAIMKPIE
jgi:hypothetical protein